MLHPVRRRLLIQYLIMMIGALGLLFVDMSFSRVVFESSKMLTSMLCGVAFGLAARPRSVEIDGDDKGLSWRRSFSNLPIHMRILSIVAMAAYFSMLFLGRIYFYLTSISFGFTSILVILRIVLMYAKSYEHNTQSNADRGQ